jgi:hypothetical protein
MANPVTLKDSEVEAGGSHIGSLHLVPVEMFHIEQLMTSLGIKNFDSYARSALLAPGHAYTILSQGRVVGCAGVMRLWAGVGEATAFLTPELRKRFPISLHKAGRWGLDLVQRQFNYHRIQMHVAPDFEAGLRWAARLGFRHEGEMPMFTPDKRTLVRFGKTWA